jgi:hypothetical protein
MRIVNPVESLIKGFDIFVLHFETKVSISSQWQRFREPHAQTMKRRGTRTAADLLEDEQFLQHLWKTLESWGMNRRKARLLPQKDFDRALRAVKDDIVALEDISLRDADESVDGRIWTIINSLRLCESERAKIVGGTKALLHFLPDLVVPIDRTYTGAFLLAYASEYEGARQQKLFSVAFNSFMRIANEVDLRPYSSHRNVWHTCPAKVIDNAIVGFVASSRLQLGWPQKAGGR